MTRLETERRQHPRYSPAGLKAVIKLGPEDAHTTMQGEVVDISYDGMKIRLETDATNRLEGKISIELFLPDSDIPLFFNGILKHINHAGELGLRYVDCPVVEALDSFMFECIKLAKH